MTENRIRQRSTGCNRGSKETVMGRVEKENGKGEKERQGRLSGGSTGWCNVRAFG